MFLDETGVLLGMTRTYARSPNGSRVYDLKPFSRGARVTVIGAIVRCARTRLTLSRVELHLG